jgi:hypothetical protein
MGRKGFAINTSGDSYGGEGWQAKGMGHVQFKA